MNELLKKLNYKGQNPLLCIKAPPALEAELGGLTDVRVDRAPSEPGYGFMMAFVKDRAELLETLARLKPLVKAETILWIGYPKQSSKNYSSDINRDSTYELMLERGLQGVRQVAVDEDWSALRFKAV